VPRLSAAELAAARGRTIADVLPGPGNRFWPVLHAAGFTPRLLRPAEQGELARLGLGITNMAPRATARADELTAAELVAGGARLRELVARLRPAWLAVVGITAYRTAFAIPTAVVGPQEPWGPTGVWVLPNPSGLNAHYQLPELTAAYAALRLTATQSSSGSSSAPSSVASRSAHSSRSSSA
jgi:TDG/mug DNA glycosylase family protein